MYVPYWPSNSTPRYVKDTPKRDIWTGAPKDKYKDVWNHIIQNMPKLETTQMSINGRMDTKFII